MSDYFNSEEERTAWIIDEGLIISDVDQDYGTEISWGIIQFIELDLEELDLKVEEYAEGSLSEDEFVPWFSEFLESHFYLKLFPPDFYVDSTEDFQDYAEYLRQLQVKFLGLVHFCFDQNHVELRDFTASQRLFILENTEFGSVPRLFQQEYTVQSFGKSKFSEKPEATIFEAQLGLPAGYLDYMREQDAFIRKKFILSSTLDALSLEFYTMIERNCKLKQCKRCFRFFQIKSKRNPDYCDYVSKNTNQTCQQIMAGKNFLERNKNNEPLKIYKKFYKRYHERTKVNTLKRDVFEKWSREACVKRDLCTDGKLDVEEFELWCHESFHNRERKNKNNSETLGEKK